MGKKILGMVCLPLVSLGLFFSSDSTEIFLPRAESSHRSRTERYRKLPVRASLSLLSHCSSPPAFKMIEHLLFLS